MAPHSGHSLHWRVAVGLVPVEIDVLFERAVHEARGAEVEDEAVDLDDAGELGGIDRAQAAADHLDHGRLVGRGPQQHDAARGRVVPALGQHRDIDRHLDVAAPVGGENVPSLALGHLTPDHAGIDARRDEGVAHVARMFDGRTENHGLAVRCLFTPVLDHRFGDRPLVHDRVDRAHVEIGGGLANLLERRLGADVDDEGARPHQVARADQLAEHDLVGDIGEHRPQTLPIATVGRCGDAVDPGFGVALAGPVDDPPVGIGGGVVGLVDDHEIERRHGVEIALSREGRNHGEGGPPAP